jgi:hypothetical protein
VAGAENPAVIRHLGFEPTASVEEAIRKAKAVHGKDAKVVFVRYPMLMRRQ